MAFEYKIKQGEDLFVELPVKDELNNNIDLTSATGIVVTFTVKGETVDKFSLNSMDDYGTLAIKAGVGNEHIIELSIKRVNSKNYPIGSIQANTLVEEADITLTDKRNEYNFVDFILVSTGYTKYDNI